MSSKPKYIGMWLTEDLIPELQTAVEDKLIAVKHAINEHSENYPQVIPPLQRKYEKLQKINDEILFQTSRSQK